jgi:hypothetical protein
MVVRWRGWRWGFLQKALVHVAFHFPSYDWGFGKD